MDSGHGMRRAVSISRLRVNNRGRSFRLGFRDDERLLYAEDSPDATWSVSAFGMRFAGLPCEHAAERFGEWLLRNSFRDSEGDWTVEWSEIETILAAMLPDYLYAAKIAA